MGGGGGPPGPPPSCGLMGGGGGPPGPPPSCGLMGGVRGGVSPGPASPSGTESVERSDTTALSSGAPRRCEPGWSVHINSFSNVSGPDDGASPRNAPPPSPGEGSSHGSVSADGGSGGSLSGRRGIGSEGFAKRSGNS